MMRVLLSAVLTFAVISVLVTEVRGQNNVWWNADGTKTLTQDEWLSAGDTDYSVGEADTGTNGVWRITDTDSGINTRMYRDPGVSSSQGLVMARIKYINHSGLPKGTFGYSTAEGDHSVVISVRSNEVNIKSCQEHNTTYNNGDSLTVPYGTSSYRVYALRYYSDGVYDLWVSNGSEWSSDSSDWTQLVSGGGWSGQSALLDGAVPCSGLVLGSFGGPATGATWDGCIDYIAWSKTSGELQPWDFDPADALPDDAQLISDTIPATMTPGQPYEVSITLQNTGQSTWKAEDHKLAAIGDFDPFYASTRVLLEPEETVAPNQQKTFTFTMNAPSTVGTYLTDWQMTREGVRYFGDTMSKVVTVGNDLSAPGPVTDFQAAIGDQEVSLSWRNSTDADFTGVMIRYRTTTYPTSPVSGTLLCELTGPPGAVNSLTHTGLVNGRTYYYSAMAYDALPRYSVRALAAAMPYRVGAPGPPQNFTAAAGDGYNLLAWTNPTDPDYVATKILYKTSGFPTDYEDGTVVYSGSGTGFTHSGLSNGVTCFYSAYAFDDTQEHSSPADAGAIPTDGACFAEHFLYDDGNLTGTNGWQGSSTADQIEVLNHAIRIDGWDVTHDNYRYVTCSPDQNGIIWMQARIKSGVGESTMWGLLMDDENGVSLARWYGTPTTARGRIGGTASVTPVQDLTGIWDCIAAKVDTVADTTEFFFNGTSLGALSHYQEGNYAGDSIARIRIECIGNLEAEGNYVSLDNLFLGQADVTPPSAVTSFEVIPGNEANNLIWANPSDADYAGVVVRFKTSGYPTSITDGTLCYDGNGTGCRHEGLANGTAYYYSAFAYDGVANYSAKADADGTPLRFDPLQAKLLEDNTPVTLTSGVISAVFAEKFYVQDENRPIGIRVDKSGHGLSVGQLADVQGAVETDSASGEKYISAEWAQAYDVSEVFPVAMNGWSCGGTDWNYSQSSTAGQKGVQGGLGPNNIGLLVNVWGKVTQRDTSGLSYLYIDDGSGMLDGTQTDSEDNVGMRVQCDPTDYPSDSFVFMTGIVSCFKDNYGNLLRMILPRAGDIRQF